MGNILSGQFFSLCQGKESKEGGQKDASNLESDRKAEAGACGNGDGVSIFAGTRPCGFAAWRRWENDAAV